MDMGASFDITVTGIESIEEPNGVTNEVWGPLAGTGDAYKYSWGDSSSHRLLSCQHHELATHSEH
jgi:hypothetical protein